MPQFEFFHTFLLSVDVVFDRRNENQNKCIEKIQNVARSFCMRLHASNFRIRFPSHNIKVFNS